MSLGGVGSLEGPRRAAVPPPLSCSELCPRGAEPVQPVKPLGDAEVSASGLRTKGSLERAGPEVPRPPGAPAPGFYSPHPGT